MSDVNMQIWDALRTPPADALKPIKGGRLNGKLDISPQWRYEALTRQFGPCGDGWWFIVDKLWTENGTDGQRFAFAQVSLFVGEHAHPVPGIGGSMLTEKETKGLHDSDEAYKMAVTDALGTAAKMIGLAADVYRGLFDGKQSKDNAEPSEQRPAAQSNNDVF